MHREQRVLKRRLGVIIGSGFNPRVRPILINRNRTIAWDNFHPARSSSCGLFFTFSYLLILISSIFIIYHTNDPHCDRCRLALGDRLRNSIGTLPGRPMR